MDHLSTDRLSDMDITVDNNVRKSLSESGKWAKFISIAIFVICGLVLLLGVVGGNALSNAMERYGGRYGDVLSMYGSVIIGIVVFIILITVFWYYFLFNFSAKIKTALASENTETMNKGLNALKIFFIVSTIISMITLALTLIGLF